LEFTKVTLLHYYSLDWELPLEYLCPTVPSRANYVHSIADLFLKDDGAPLEGPVVRGLDIGVGANCIYCLLAVKEYGWSMVGTDISPAALSVAEENVKRNHLSDKIKMILQPDCLKVFDGVFNDAADRFCFCLCNPPFHESTEQMNTNPIKDNKATELESVCQGGEVGFISRIIEESARRPRQFMWFTSLVARAASMKRLVPILAEKQPSAVRRVTLFQGKQTRWMLCWSFMSDQERAGLIRYLASETPNLKGPL